MDQSRHFGPLFFKTVSLINPFKDENEAQQIYIKEPKVKSVRCVYSLSKVEINRTTLLVYHRWYNMVNVLKNGNIGYYFLSNISNVRRARPARALKSAAAVTPRILCVRVASTDYAQLATLINIDPWRTLEHNITRYLDKTNLILHVCHYNSRDRFLCSII